MNASHVACCAAANVLLDVGRHSAPFLAVRVQDLDSSSDARVAGITAMRALDVAQAGAFDVDRIV